MTETKRKWLVIGAVFVASLFIVPDVGVLATEAAVLPAFAFGRGIWLRHLLLISWTMSAAEFLAQTPMATVVFSYTMMDLTIAGAALGRVTHDPARTDAKLIGAVSMALMPAHWIVSAAQGHVNWPLYAAGCNAGFVLQCLIVGGWLDGLGRRTARFFARLHPVHIFRRREQ